MLDTDRSRAADVLSRFRFDADSLRPRARRIRPDYRTAEPFPHVVINEFLPSLVADALLSLFPDEGIALRSYSQDGPQPGKSDLGDNVLMREVDDAFRKALLEFNSLDFLLFLRTLTGIDHLIPDPWFAGGGPHHCRNGGRLEVHRDFNVHPVLGLHRRVNVLLYLNPGWREEHGGGLELWNAEATACRARILPLHNRCVVFTLSDVSWHGHPIPVAAPPGWARRSIAFYYYTKARPSWFTGPRPTEWLAR